MSDTPKTIRDMGPVTRSIIDGFAREIKKAPIRRALIDDIVKPAIDNITDEYYSFIASIAGVLTLMIVMLFVLVGMVGILLSRKHECCCATGRGLRQIATSAIV